jgi:hypothetical protein
VTQALLPGRETWLRASIFGAAALCLLAPLAASKALDLLVSTIAGARMRRHAGPAAPA